MDVLRILDERLFFFIHNFSNSFFDYLLGWPTYLGKIYITLPIAFYLLLRGDRFNLYIARFAALFSAVFSASLLTRAVKHLVARERPMDYFNEAIKEGAVQVQVLFSTGSEYSFPSGHTTIVFAAVTALHLSQPVKRPWLWAVACWVGVTRVYTGAHFPSDVLAGALVGILWTWGLYKLIILKVWPQINSSAGHI